MVIRYSEEWKKKLTADGLPILRDFEGHKWANEKGFNVWTTFYGTVAVPIKRRE